MHRKKKAVDPAVVALILTFLLLPPLAPIAIIFFLIYKRSKQEAPGQDKTEQDSFGEKLIRRMKEEEIQEQPYKSKPHGHTPEAYSYDSCVREKRLEQLKVLKDAGLLDDAEYHQRRQAILAQC